MFSTMPSLTTKRLNDALSATGHLCCRILHQTPFLSALRGLRVDDRHRRACFTSLLLAHRHVQRVMERLPLAGPTGHPAIACPGVKELEEFFVATNALEAKTLKFLGWRGPAKAIKTIKKTSIWTRRESNRSFAAASLPGILGNRKARAGRV
jgi:hypothetical protein